MTLEAILETLDNFLAENSPGEQVKARDLIKRLKGIIKSAPRRSASANKAWVTRRANATKAARSEAANKAWATRRQNGWVHPKNRK